MYSAAPLMSISTRDPIKLRSMSASLKRNLILVRLKFAKALKKYSFGLTKDFIKLDHPKIN